MSLKINLIFLLVVLKICGFNSELNDIYKKLPRFWTNTGFCPTAPINQSESYFLSNDLKLNLEIISSLPNHGLSHVRVHWILELIRFEKFLKNDIPFYDFSKFDLFLDHLIELKLHPVLEFMGNPSEIFTKKLNISAEFLWEDLVFQIVSRAIKRYGLDEVSQWKFETWNEPDIKNYNILNFTLPNFWNYCNSVKDGLKAAERTTFGSKFYLNGPAGLFKSKTKHPLCWGVLQKCNDDLLKCPFDSITFHRKGNGTAEEIVQGGIDLVKELIEEFPNLDGMKYSNDEADPVAGWSNPIEFHSDVRYGIILISTVILHWQAKMNNQLRNLESISHDNAFLSYHPHEFNQRTLLARFQMNLTNPPHVQFFVKPVYGALAFLGNLGETAIVKNDSILSKSGENYQSLVICSENEKEEVLVKIKNLGRFSVGNVKYLTESIETSKTDPNFVWMRNNSPSYPNWRLRRLMRKSQSPRIIEESNITEKAEELILRYSLKAPWIVQIRICRDALPKPAKVHNVRVRKVNENEVLVFWSESFLKERCIKRYEVFFKSNLGGSVWKNISKGWPVSYLFFQFDAGINRTVSGHYKVRAVDIFNRKSQFSKAHKYQQK